MDNKKHHKRVFEFLKRIQCKKEKDTTELKRELVVLSDRIHDFLYAFVASNIPAVHMDIGGTDELQIVFEVAVGKFLTDRETGEMTEKPRETYRDVLMFIGRASTSDEAYKGKDVYSGFPTFIMIEKKEVILLRVSFPLWKETIGKIGLKRLSQFVDLAGADANDSIQMEINNLVQQEAVKKGKELKDQKESDKKVEEGEQGDNESKTE